MFQVIKPRINEKINILKEKIKSPKKLQRELFISTIFLILIFYIFKGSFFFIALFPSPFYPINLILKMLFILVLFSGSIISINEFFISKDLNVFLTSPLSLKKLYIGKIFITLFRATWMPLCILMPYLISLGIFYNQNIFYYFVIPFIIIPFLCISILTGNFLVFLFSKLLPIKIFKEIIFFFYLGVFLGIGMIVKKLCVGTLENTFQHLESNFNILPFNQASNILENLLSNHNFQFLNFSLLYLTLFLLFTVSFFIFKKNYFDAINSITSFSSSNAISIKFFECLFLKVTKFCGTNIQGQFLKEYKIFIRNMSQTSQLFLLLGIIFLYFSNFKIINYEIPSDSYHLGLLIIINFSICTFILIAFCSRFVFPSLSLEAKNYDIYLKSPTSLKKFFNIKKFFWLLTLSCISSIIFISSALTLNFSYSLLASSLIFSILLSYGLVNIAMFIGTFFLNLNWKTPYELCASVGSFCFMLVGILYLLSSLLLYYFFSNTLNMLNKKMIDIGFLIVFLIFNLILSSLITTISVKKLKQLF